MRRIHSAGTNPEMIVRRLVHGMGFRYKLHDHTLPGKPDMVFPRLRKIIEVRGCFWHQHQACVDGHQPKSQKQYWNPKLIRNCERDARNEMQLRQLGWSVLIIWECELKDIGRVATSLTKFLSVDCSRDANMESLRSGVGA